MGLSSLFSKEARKERALAKAIAKANDKKYKPDDRYPSLYFLVENGSSEAIVGLMGRFNFTYDINTIKDEEEKDYVYQALLAKGKAILPELKIYLNKAPTRSWGLRLLKELFDDDTVWEVASELLATHEPTYERDPTKKQQILTFLSDFVDPRVSAAIVPFIDDHDETVRFITIEALFAQGHKDVAREPLIEHLLDEEEESLRIKNRIAEGFIQTGWDVKGYRGTVEKLFASLANDFVVDGKGKIKKKKGK